MRLPKARPSRARRPRRAPLDGRRAGFTLAELMIAVTLLMAVFAMAIPFFVAQTRSMTRTSGQLDAQQNASNAVLQLDRDIRAAGVGLVDRQPMLVQAAPDAITFNTDFLSATTTDQGAFYVDSTVDLGAVSALTRDTPVTLPRSTWTYPGDTARWTGGPAETISLWVEPDVGGAMAGPPGTMRLMRRVNGGTAQVVAQRLETSADDPVFRYFVRDSSGRLREVGAAALPMRHTDHVHQSGGESAMSLRIDSVRAVRVRLTSQYRDARDVRQPVTRRTLERTVRMPNAGLSRFETCGKAPSAPTNVVAVRNTGLRTVTLSWDASADENGNERDVERYVVFRRGLGAPAFAGDPLVAVAAGSATNSYVDTQVPAGTWVYGVAAMDCGRALSTATATAAQAM